jgi:ABC-type phosphate/phosphonate transport system permease subunit
MLALKDASLVRLTLLVGLPLPQAQDYLLLRLEPLLRELLQSQKTLLGVPDLVLVVIRVKSIGLGPVPCLVLAVGIAKIGFLICWLRPSQKMMVLQVT